MVIVASLGVGAALALASCVTYTEALNRGQRHFQANEYEQALAIWRMLERDIDSLPPGDRARYAYFRGMTDYRMSLREDARHWLAMARAYDQAVPGGIEDAWRERMKEALKDLQAVRGGPLPSHDAGGLRRPPHGQLAANGAASKARSHLPRAHRGRDPSRRLRATRDVAAATR
jgi:hypothetical protein